MKRITSLIGLILLMSTILTACNLKDSMNVQEDTLNLYFFDPNQNDWIVEEIKVQLDEKAPSESKMNAVIDALNKGPRTTNLQGSVPMDLKIKNISLKDQTAFVNFLEEYAALEIDDQMMIRASLVYSLTDLEFITGVEFLKENQPITNSKGEKIGEMTRSNVLTSALDPTPPTDMQTIILYFTKPNSDKLYAEPRDIQFNENIPLEKYIMDELIKGPETEGLISTLPVGTKLNDIKTQENVSQVDLSYDKVMASPIGEQLLVYSIVNSLTEVPQIKKISFLKDGKKQTDVTGTIDFNTLFERNEELIATEE
ncbi:MAG: GerMN domain-containing protein [Cellulosilyticaceae bacterium]